MAARRRRASAPGQGRSRGRKRGPKARVLDSVQQVWLAGMGAIARAQREGPAAFQDAVADGLQLLNRSRASAERMLVDAFDAAHGSLQGRVGSALDQATETWDNLEALFQSRVQKALQQIGVPTADEVRELARHVTELNDLVRTYVRDTGGVSRRVSRPKKRATSGRRRRAKRSG